jgi:hypothetical protein
MSSLLAGCVTSTPSQGNVGGGNGGNALAGGLTSEFDPSRYIGQGDRYNCADFSSQSQAQAVLRADPRDPNRLDADRDGLACETNGAPRDAVRVTRP